MTKSSKKEVKHHKKKKDKRSRSSSSYSSESDGRKYGSRSRSLDKKDKKRRSKFD